MLFHSRRRGCHGSICIQRMIQHMPSAAPNRAALARSAGTYRFLSLVSRHANKKHMSGKKVSLGGVVAQAGACIDAEKSSAT